MTIIMAVIVTPFGVIAAVYLREYAKQGLLTRIIRIAVNNLAGVPSIVYGVFGLGFFVYVLGGSIDRLFYPEAAPAPVFGTPGLMWASLTLAILTLPVVIVATEEGLARIPRMIREGSLALGATKSETLWKVVLPMASPAMMTGLILAVARAAGEVAPLMLVGVVKLAPTLPLNGNYPYLHLDQKIMHLASTSTTSASRAPTSRRRARWSTPRRCCWCWSSRFSTSARWSSVTICARSTRRWIINRGRKPRAPARACHSSLQLAAANGVSTCKPTPIPSTSPPSDATNAA